jgi:hypothetical protein
MNLFERLKPLQAFPRLEYSQGQKPLVLSFRRSVREAKGRWRSPGASATALFECLRHVVAFRGSLEEWS